MTREAFWRAIGLVDRAALEAGDEDGAVAPLIAYLAAQHVDAIRGFEEQLAQVLFALDGKAHADFSGSDDGFLYARCYVVAQGEAQYARVLADPTAMPRSSEEWCEPLLYVGGNAWAEQTGEDAEDWDAETSVSYETGANEARWAD